ncbi:hypothetical protein HK096_006881 [Nowakowskiella sp. JEL0078]|nr:hypothetical protein HK096_006881 [Nowakowskiella sp. JEL0078]
MHKTALLYTEKPAPLMNADQMILARLQTRSLDQNKHLRSNRRVIQAWKRVKKAKQNNNNRCQNYGNHRISQNEANSILHDDISRDEFEINDFNKIAFEAKAGIKFLFEKARKEYEAGDIYMSKLTLRELIGESQTNMDTITENMPAVELEEYLEGLKSDLKFSTTERYLISQIRKLGGDIPSVREYF